MNFSRYCSIYSRFHGATSYRTEQDIMILDLFEEPFHNWILLRMSRFDDIHMRPKNAFAKALQMFLQSQSPLTVFCQNDTWIALLGRERYITPIVSDQANFQLYATPYFVRDPSALADVMQTHHSDTVFQYKSCIVYLDRQDLPYPGGCYFSSNTEIPPSLYRICVLSREPLDVALPVATEWRTRRDIVTLPFPTTDATHIPAMIKFLPVDPPYLPNERVLSTGNIQKRLSMYQPQCLIQDILLSFQRNKNLKLIRGVGLVIEWPFRIPFEGTRTVTTEPSRVDKKFVALVVNELRPSRILLVRYPYEVYTEYNEVPAIPYISLHFTPTFLELPSDMKKVSVDSTVIGYEYEKGFYCFSFPLLEGRPTEDRSRHLDCLAGVARKFHPDDVIKFTFRVDDTLVLHKVHTETGLSHGWRLAKTEDKGHTWMEAGSLPSLVSEWLQMFRLHDKAATPIDVKMLQLALTLARHKICFTTRIETGKQKKNQMVVTDEAITLCLGQDEVTFINSQRADTGLDWTRGGEEEEVHDNNCTIM